MTNQGLFPSPHTESRPLQAKGGPSTPHGTLAALTLGALGVVFGDIGTSPLYAINEIFFGHGNVSVTPDHVLGALSLVLWALTIVVALKYTLFVLRAHNDGEGGVFALYGLLHKFKRRNTTLVLWMLMLGAGLLFGDGIITPAISVLSAVEGLNAAAPALSYAVIPLTVLILTCLFAFQSKGTAKVGSVFGPILIVWFLAIAFLGARQIIHTPEILKAFNPLYGLALVREVGMYDTLLVLGAIMLVLTGGEAMYADLGHFGAKPIRTSWFLVVYPALLLNYLGQGAFLLSGASVAQGSLFYSLVPSVALFPMIILATVATVIASQAMISGAFSLASQAIRLGLFPRLHILYTHKDHAGQVYVPFINWALYTGCIVLVFAFRTSSALATTYGLAVSGDMTITSIAMLFIARLYWKWDVVRTVALFGVLGALDALFLVANSLKFLDGGFVPVSIGVALFMVMYAWKRGRKATSSAYTAKHTMPVSELVDLHRRSTVFSERNAILMVPKSLHSETDNTPALLQLLWDRHGILPRNLIFVHVVHPKVPYIHDNRYEIRVLERAGNGGSIVSVDIKFGFMENPNVEDVLEDLACHKEINLPIDRNQWIVHVSKEHLMVSRRLKFGTRLLFGLFAFLRQMSQSAYYYYGLGDKIQLSAEILPVRIR
ncbi:MAG: KUP/HAK/KT family potassium transporter [Alphaproteobacteria bacterium]|nr:KUP/HAK/KT family potassium transporter [Alphaproteobacteria bacterium]